jgi:pre-mRNA-processing factor 40
MAVWTEHTNAAGRKYWYHTQEKRSVWDKPDELRTPRERAMAATPWKEYAAGERRYYVHAETKETTWKVPKELQGEWWHGCMLADGLLPRC